MGIGRHVHPRKSNTAVRETSTQHFFSTNIATGMASIFSCQQKKTTSSTKHCKQQNHGSLAISQPFLSAGYLANRCSFFSEDSLLFFGFRNMGTLKQKGWWKVSIKYGGQFFHPNHSFLREFSKK
jgi:hypothetical protein